MTEIMKHSSGHKIIIKSAGGSSSVNLIGRFAHIDKNIHTYIKSMTKKEDELNPDIILAEIAHLPENRIGNILSRPTLRKYEIPYLSKSSVSEEYKIAINDLVISIKNNKIVLRSKKLNKEVKPCLSNAHNYSKGSLPIYHFLADMQTQNLRRSLHFDWGILGNELEYFPRVEYKNIILSVATWKIKTKEINDIINNKKENKFIELLTNFRKKKFIPQDVVLSDADNQLYINMININSVKTLLSLVKKRETFILKEFLFKDNNSIVNNSEGNTYTNEVIFSFYKSTN